MLARDFEDGYRNKDDNLVRQRPHKKNQKNRSYSKPRLLISILFIVGLCLLFLSRYTAITSIRSEITYLEKEIEELEKEKVNLQANLAGIKSSEFIEEEAMIKLGMDYPEKGQVVYISLEEIKSNKNNEYRFKDKVLNFGDKVKTFFRR